MKSVPSNFSISEPLPSSLAIASTLSLPLIPLIRSQIILSTILVIQNNNHTQEHKYLHGKLFFLKGKIMGQTPNNFIIIQINYNNSYVCFMAKEKKKLSYFSLLLHTNYLSSFLFSMRHPPFFLIVRHLHLPHIHNILLYIMHLPPPDTQYN